MNDDYKGELAPIVLFTYNRPEHTKRTLTALMQNKLATESNLYVYCDGPKSGDNDKQLENIKKVKEIVHQSQWCGKINILESTKNNGLANSIRKGITEIVNKHGNVIVMEDDLVTSPAFLTYMNKALSYYEKYKGVFSISGYCLPPAKLTIPTDYNYDVFVCLRNSSWGWATWHDRWEQIKWEVPCYYSMATNLHIKEAFNRSGDDVFDLLEMQQRGKLNIWSIQFTVAHFLNHGVSIVPTKSYVDNIGHDGSGENCHVNKSLQNPDLCLNENIKFLDILYEDKRIINAFYNVYCRKTRPLWQKTINRLCRILGFKSIFIIKKKIYC